MPRDDELRAALGAIRGGRRHFDLEAVRARECTSRSMIAVEAPGWPTPVAEVLAARRELAGRQATDEQRSQAGCIGREGERVVRSRALTLDFKQEARSEVDTLRSLADACLCFVNASGGVVVVGVSDKLAGPAALVGTTIDGEVVRRRTVGDPPLRGLHSDGSRGNPSGGPAAHT